MTYSAPGLGTERGEADTGHERSTKVRQSRLVGSRQLKSNSAFIPSFGIVWLVILWWLFLSGPSLLGSSKAEAAPFTTSRFFPQTGFFLRNRDGVNFLSEFDRLGGVATLGYPVSRVFQMGGLQHQGFQRGILQWRPEAKGAVLVNIMDELHSLGKDDWLLAKGVPPSSPDDGSGGDFNKARETRLSWLTNQNIRQAYFANPDPLGFYGLPTSQPQRQGPFIAQRFQRGVLQLWVEDVPGMPRPGVVVGVLAGDLAQELGFFAPQTLEPEYGTRDTPGELALPVPAFRQERNLSCESSAAAMAANYFGVPLTERQIVAQLPLDPNPHQGFRGNIDGWFGGIDEYGVYAEPIAQILANQGLEAEVVYGLSPEILREALTYNKVVISWITAGTAYQTPIVRDINGEKVVLVPYEHAVVVTGYDPWGVMVNDPGSGRGDYYRYEDFLRASGYFDGMAVLVSR